jgi:hypothetical protein
VWSRLKVDSFYFILRAVYCKLHIFLVRAFHDVLVVLRDPCLLQDIIAHYLFSQSEDTTEFLIPNLFSYLLKPLVINPYYCFKMPVRIFVIGLKYLPFSHASRLLINFGYEVLFQKFFLFLWFCLVRVW